MSIVTSKPFDQRFIEKRPYLVNEIVFNQKKVGRVSIKDISHKKRKGVKNGKAEKEYDSSNPHSLEQIRHTTSTR